jgi:hypothetical protein
LASNEAVSKRDLAAGFNQIRIGCGRNGAARLRVASSRPHCLPARD